MATLSSGDRTVTVNSFETGYMTGLPTSGDYNAIAVGDVNGDGDLDMAVSTDDYGSAGTTGLYVYTGSGTGTWTGASSGLPTADSWGGLALGDADGDGRMELYAGNEGWGSSGGSIKGLGAWEYNSGTWSTTGISSPVTSGTVNDVKLLNFTKDGSLDLAISYSRSQSGILVYYGSGSSPITWTSNSAGLPTSGEWTGVGIGDMNNDGLPDLASGSYSNSGIKFFTQNSAGNGWTDRTSSLPSGYTSGNVDGMEIGDADGDGNGDLLFSSSNGGLKLLLGNGGGTGGTSFTWTDVSSSLPSVLRSSRFFQFLLRDWDGDGDMDLLAPKQSSGLHIFLGNGSIAHGTSFGFTEITGKGLPTNGVYIGSAFIDFDGDGMDDIAGASWGSGVKVYRSNVTIVDEANTPPVPVATGGGDLVLGGIVQLNGTGSTDEEDAPGGDTTGTVLKYNWNLTLKPSGSALTDASFSPSDSSAAVTLTPDRPGRYEVTLSVRDTRNKPSEKAREAKISFNATNAAPIADAGEDIDASTGTWVYLNGSGSYDPDGHDLVLDWNVTSYPGGSLIRDGSFHPSDKVDRPGFVPDRAGTYVISLSVRDEFGTWSLVEDEVLIRAQKPNEAPIADAGPDINTFIDSTVILDGSRSRDLDGEVVSYNWTCVTHTVTIENGTSMMASFVPEEPSTYIIRLIVEDDNGTLSEPYTLRVRVFLPWENLPPVAYAGYDATYDQGETVMLDGSGSYDIDGTVEGWEWNCTSQPDLAINGSDTASAWFVAEQAGTYNITLRVQDNRSEWSDPDQVVITVLAIVVNQAPVADAGEDMVTDEGLLVTFDGSGSYDPDGAIDLYIWNCTSHEAVLSDGGTPHPYFVPEEPGVYTFTLVVIDNEGARSDEDEVVLTVSEVEDPPVDTNVTPRIGPVLYDDSTVVMGAVVRLSGPGGTFQVNTDIQGHAEFLQGIPPGTYTLNITKGAHESMQIEGVVINGTGAVIYPGGTLPRLARYIPDTIDDPDENGEAQFPWAILIVVAIAMIVLGAVIVVAIALASKKGRVESEDDDICPECGSGMEFRKDFNTYFCPDCGGAEE